MPRYLAEALGTFALLFIGTGAIVVNDATGALGHLGVALCFGGVVMCMIYALGEISGAHLNPAVSAGFVLAGRLPAGEGLRFAGSQIAGALLASALLRVLFPEHGSLGSTAPSGSAAQSFVLEVVLSFFLMFVILAVSTGAKEKGITAAIAVGATVGLAALMGGPVSGASMNPARSLAPALLSGQLAGLWIYLLAPPLGAGLAVLGCRSVHGAECCRSLGTADAAAR